jgi:hypothetical protein
MRSALRSLLDLSEIRRTPTSPCSSRLCRTALQGLFVSHDLLGWDPPIRDRLKGQKAGQRSLSLNLF